MNPNGVAESASSFDTRSLLRRPAFLRDMLLSLLFAVLTGIIGGLVLILLVFGCSTAQAGTEMPSHGRLDLYALDGRPLQAAPLLHSDVSIQITGMLAWVRVEQRFSNPTDQWLEGIYQFPLPEGSAVEAMRMLVGERVIEGHIEEKQKARQVYQAAKAAGQRASLLSQERPNIFTSSVANIAPGETLRVIIEYQQTLHYTQRRFELRFPLVVGPRYIPGSPITGALSPADSHTGWARDTDQVADASHITPPVADPADGKINPVSIEVSLDAGIPLASVKSHYHRMRQTQDAAGIVHLQLADGVVPTDRDFLLSWQPEEGMQPRAAIFTERWQDEDYALLMLMPPDQESEAQRLPREMIFVLDHSGSMHGESMSQAKAALALALSRLRDEDRFNLIAFNDQTHALFEQARPGTASNRRLALEYLYRLEADGGTEMMPALRLALKTDEEGGRLRQVVFLTDGSVGNEEALFDLIRQRLAGSRLFTIGIGTAPNSFFMQRAADFGRGSFTYIGDLKEVESRMQALFQKLENPAMSNLQLTWSGDQPLQIQPSRLPDLYLDEPLMLAFKGKALSGELVVQGDRDGSHWRQPVVMAPGESKTGLHKLWARRRIAELMSVPASGETAQAARRETVLELALTHQLVSAYTSLVAVEQQPVRPPEASLGGGMMPVNLPQGWDARHVFGGLPQTATAAPLQLLLGMLLMLGGFWWRRRTRL